MVKDMLIYSQKKKAGERKIEISNLCCFHHEIKAHSFDTRNVLYCHQKKQVEQRAFYEAVCDFKHWERKLNSPLIKLFVFGQDTKWKRSITHLITRVVATSQPHASPLDTRQTSIIDARSEQTLQLMKQYQMEYVKQNNSLNYQLELDRKITAACDSVQNVPHNHTALLNDYFGMVLDVVQNPSDIGIREKCVQLMNQQIRASNSTPHENNNLYRDIESIVQPRTLVTRQRVPSAKRKKISVPVKPQS